MASFRLLTKILTDFLSVIYLLTLVLKHATNHTQTRWQQAEKFVKPRKILIEFDNLVSLIKRNSK